METEVKEIFADPMEFEATSRAEISVSVYFKEEPVAFRFVRSGWTNPTMYHVILEHGDFESADYKGLMSEEQIKETYGIEISGNLDIKDLVKQFPNNMELGNAIRSISNKLTQNTKI